MKNYDLMIIGGCASGLAAAINAKRLAPEARIAVAERLPRVGKKLLATGNGRCNLTNIHAIGHEYKNREFFDLVTARAVAQANILLELAAPLAKDKIVLMKGNINDELKNSEHFETELGIKLLAKKEFFLPIENSKRTLICYEKIAKTPLKYPRRYDQIKKRPL